MNFRTFYHHLNENQRERFARAVGTTVGYCRQIAGGRKRLELGLADAIIAVANQFGCEITHWELDLTPRAMWQRRVRMGLPHPEPKPSKGYFR